MRLLGPVLVAFLSAAVTAGAQPPQPPPPAPPAAALDAHLKGWEKAMGQLQNFSTTFELTRKNAVFNNERKYDGSLLWMKPTNSRLAIQGRADKADYEAFVCNAKSVFHYDGAKKTVTEFKAAPAGAGADNLLLAFLGGMTAADAKKRFQLTLKEDSKNYVTLDVRPLLARDKQEFTHAVLALLAPTNEGRLPAYLPYEAWKQLPNGDTEVWKLRQHKADALNVTATLFEYEPVAGWKLQPAPALPPR
ncbi:TIGR03009 domain-containing protein [bacterium]|nr:TIGR03009 domain-containing protein [bacterium]